MNNAGIQKFDLVEASIRESRAQCAELAATDLELGGRELALVRTKLQEAQHWLDDARNLQEKPRRFGEPIYEEARRA